MKAGFIGLGTMGAGMEEKINEKREEE